MKAFPFFAGAGLMFTCLQFPKLIPHIICGLAIFLLLAFAVWIGEVGEKYLLDKIKKREMK